MYGSEITDIHNGHNYAKPAKIVIAPRSYFVDL
jgi:hypothetical protein